ncbi:sugar transferase [Candidatus Dependentiae bacterium]|nr:sugar transferase [Candidatus Dependentiae bacterium]
MVLKESLKRVRLQNIGLVVSNVDETESIKRLLINEVGEEIIEYISSFINFSESSTFHASTTTRFNIDKLPPRQFTNIVNIQKINDIRWINKFFESVNNKIPKGGYFIGTAETYQLRNKYLFNKYPVIINFFAVQSNFFVRRVFPKLPVFKKLYFFLTKGRGRGLSKAETLGRLASCGFEIIEYKEINNLLIFITKKIKEPVYDLNPSYGPLFKMRRVGKNGKIIYVYKFRTMHPYAEYLQDFILKQSGYSENGKPANDFRLTTWGKFMRRYWLDELPQLINVLKGDMVLVGIRPLSKRFLQEYPEDVIKMRLKRKPGCVPPYVAHLKQEVSEYIESERKYLTDKEKYPYTTDIKIFFTALFNIFTHKIRSS